MFNPDHFTGAAKRMCALAMNDAARLKHPCVGTEHLLCAIMGDPQDNPGKHVLISLRVKPAELLNQLLMLEIPLSKNKPPLRLAPIAERVFGKVAMEAKDLGFPYVGTEHFLLAMAKEDCAAIKMLENLGVKREELITRLLSMLGT
jgi:ATP-dependent Clp protease ATP-binding subunit ClpC